MDLAWRKGGISDEAALPGGAVKPSSRPSPPPPKICTSNCQSCHDAGLGSSAPPTWGMQGEMGWRLRALEVERSPPTSPFPQARKVKDTSKAAQIPAWPEARNNGLPRGGCGPGPGWLQALPQPRSPCQVWQGEGDPQSWVLSAPPNKRMWSPAASTRGWWQGWSLLPGHPPVPSPTLSKGVDPRAEPSPGEQVWPGRWLRERWGSWSLWHLQGRHLRLHLEVLAESDHCVPAGGQEQEPGLRREARWARLGDSHREQVSPAQPQGRWMFVFLTIFFS